MEKYRWEREDSAVSLGEIQDAFLRSVPDGRADAITDGGWLIIHRHGDVSRAERDAVTLSLLTLNHNTFLLVNISC